MKRKIINSSIIVGIVICVGAMTFPVAALAQADQEGSTQSTNQNKREDIQTRISDNKTEAKTRLADAKLKMCQNREKMITNIMSRIGDRGQKQVEFFGKIADRVQAFYVKKDKTLSNYDALVADVATKKADAQAAVEATKSTVVQFACDGTDPKGVASTFKEQAKSQNEALKAYRSAIKDLIVGVKSVQASQTTSEHSSAGSN